MSLSYRRMRHSRPGSVMILTNDVPAFQHEFFICSFGDFLQRRPVAFPFKKVTSAASLGLMAGLPLALPGQVVFGSPPTAPWVLVSFCAVLGCCLLSTNVHVFLPDPPALFISFYRFTQLFHQNCHGIMRQSFLLENL